MKTKPHTSRSDYDNPATYRIVVSGLVPVGWHDRLEGMTITQAQEDQMEVVQQTTTLHGELADQAALAGVISTLYELRLPVILLERLS